MDGVQERGLQLPSGMTLRTDTRAAPRKSSNEQIHPRRGMKSTHKCILAWNVIFFVYCWLDHNCVGCSAQPTGEVRLVDLTHTFDENSVYWPTQKKLELTILHNGTDPDGKIWYQSDEISAGNHGGTHMDSPCHFALGRWCISDILFKRLVAPAAVVDISGEVGDDPSVHLTPDHLKKWEEEHGQIPDASVLLVRTGWARFYPDLLKYSGTAERDVSQLKFPSVTPEAAKWLVENRNIVGLGIDVMSIDVPGSLDVHTTLLGKNIYALENVNLVEPLSPTGVKLYILPMKLKGASGAPCRILAEVPEGMTNGNATSSSVVSQIWIALAVVVFCTLKSGSFFGY